MSPVWYSTEYKYTVSTHPYSTMAGLAGRVAPYVHPTAIVQPGAALGAGSHVGPQSIVGPGVRLDDGVRLVASAHLAGESTIGAHSVIYPFACVGLPPQDKKHMGEATRLEIGAHCVVREHATVHTGTLAGGSVTRVGNRCLLMGGAHVAHDCWLGDDVIVANATLLAGHVRVGSQTIVGGQSAVHQYVTIGRGAIIGGGSIVERDVGPFCMAVGNRASLRGLNLVGLRRRGVARAEIKALLQAFRRIFGGQGSCLAAAPTEPAEATAERAQAVRAAFASSAHAVELAEFVLDTSRRRPLCTLAPDLATTTGKDERAHR